jgi:hypothetical protein
MGMTYSMQEVTSYAYQILGGQPKGKWCGDLGEDRRIYVTGINLKVTGWMFMDWICLALMITVMYLRAPLID